MRKLLAAWAIAALLSPIALMSPAAAKNFAVPSNDPAMTIGFPKDWTTEEINYGYVAKDPDGDVAIYVESASGEKGADAMMKLNDEWMVEQKIKRDGKPDERQVDFGQVKGTLYSYAAHDPDGPTILQFLVIPASDNRVILVTVWGSKEQREKHQAELDTVFNSLKPIE